MPLLDRPMRGYQIGTTQRLESYGVMPVIAVQTAASSGAHLTKYSNITDPVTGQKKLIVDEAITPRGSVFDFKITLDSPMSLTLDGGLDGIAHAWEVFTGTKGPGYEKVKEVAELCIRLIVFGLQKIKKDRRDLEGRIALGLGTDLGGYSIMLGGTGGPHLGSFSLIDVLSHGRACALLNPYYTVLFAPVIQDHLNGKCHLQGSRLYDLYRAALKDLINTQETLEVVAETASGGEALKIIKQFPADLVLLDLRLPDKSGYDILPELSKNTEAKMLILSILESDHNIRAAFEARADGYCFKDASSQEILDAISSVLVGARYVSQKTLSHPGERRAEQRQTCDYKIVWTYFNKDQSVSARVLNYSRGGCYFETPQHLATGSTVSIRLDRSAIGSQGNTAGSVAVERSCGS